jgi:hypothetical protein
MITSADSFKFVTWVLRLGPERQFSLSFYQVLTHMIFPTLKLEAPTLLDASDTQA